MNLYVVFAAYQSKDTEEAQHSWLTSVDGDRTIYLNDPNRSWFQTCRQWTLRKISSGINEACKGGGFDKKIFVGTSMGGYAALAYARMFDAYAIALAPQTLLVRNRLHLRAHENYDKMIARLGPKPIWMPDVAPYASRKMAIVYDSCFHFDKFHAERMGSIVNLYPQRMGCGHGIARCLRMSGQLKDVMRLWNNRK